MRIDGGIAVALPGVINYGDAHFRRTDNGNAVYNAFVGNYMMDAFTTEIGAEVLVAF